MWEMVSRSLWRQSLCMDSPYRFITSRSPCIWFRKLCITTVALMVTGVMMGTACRALAATAPAMHRGMTSVMAGKVAGMAIDVKLN